MATRGGAGTVAGAEAAEAALGIIRGKYFAAVGQRFAGQYLEQLQPGRAAHARSQSLAFRPLSPEPAC